MPGFGHGFFSMKDYEKRKRMREIMNKYRKAAKKGPVLPIAKSPVPPAPLWTSGVQRPRGENAGTYVTRIETTPVQNPYHFMPREQVQDALLHAVLNDDIGTLNLIRQIYTDAANWKIVASGWVGSERITLPVIFYATGGTGEALDWLIKAGADLRAEGNFTLNPVVAHATSKGHAAAVVRLLQAMKVDDTPSAMGSLTFKHLSEVADHFGHPALARALRHYRGEEDVAPPAQLNKPKPALPNGRRLGTGKKIIDI